MTIEATQTIPLTISKDGSIRVKGTRLPIERVIYAYKNGECPEEIFDSFPSNVYTVADIYLVIAYYLQNKAKIEKYIEEREEEARKIKEKIESEPGYIERSEELKQKILKRKKRLVKL